MGLTYIDVRVASPAQPAKGEKLSFLVDSGAVYSVVPRDILARLGIDSHSRRELTLANGEKVPLEIGTAVFEYNDRRGDGLVVFGAEGSVPLLGATTLEGFGFVIDPYNRTLHALPMLLA